MECGSRDFEVCWRWRGHYYQIDGWIGEQFGNGCSYVNSREILRNTLAAAGDYRGQPQFRDRADERRVKDRSAQTISDESHSSFLHCFPV